MENIIRQRYLDSIEKHLGKNTIIIIVGQRRIGKSCILKLFRERIERTKDSNVIYINKEKKEFDDIRTYQDLNDYIEAHRNSQKKNYVLIDEIQDIERFELSVRSYYDEPDVEIVITGSNSEMLSSDLSSKIGGRYVEIFVQALSYEEFMEFHHLPDDDSTLSKYIQFGGLPGLIQTGLDENDAREYQMNVYRTVLMKDIILRHNIRNSVFLDNLVHFLADNAGKVISASSISKYMKSQGENVAPTSVINYIQYLCDAYIIHRVNRYDIHGKKIFETNDKFYFEDSGLRNALAGGTREGDIEKVIENIVYSHLVRLGYTVRVGLLREKEIDFVCTKPAGERIYVQVSYLIADETSRKREFGNLKSINDNYRKYVISMTPLLMKNDDGGITHINLRKFLTEGL